jgi:hypothetical protein
VCTRVQLMEWRNPYGEREAEQRGRSGAPPAAEVNRLSGLIVVRHNCMGYTGGGRREERRLGKMRVNSCNYRGAAYSEPTAW